MEPGGLRRAWLGVEVRHLAALIAVRDEGSFHSAAARLGYVQSAVSQQIAQLERIVGCRLIERSRGHQSLRFTPEGELMLEHAERISAQLRAAQADVSSAMSGEGRLRVGAFGSVASRVMPPVLSALQAQPSPVAVQAHEALTDQELFALVERGELDAAFAEAPLLPGPFEGVTLLADPLVLVVQADSPLARSASAPTLAEIAALPLIALSGWRMLERIERDLKLAGRPLEFVSTASSRAAVHGFVAAGLGAALLPRLAVNADTPGIAVVELDGFPERQLALYWHRERQRSEALARFGDAARMVCARLGRAQRRVRAAA